MQSCCPQLPTPDPHLTKQPRQEERAQREETTRGARKAVGSHQTPMTCCYDR
jgi:hypothetical protein